MNDSARLADRVQFEEFHVLADVKSDCLFGGDAQGDEAIGHPVEAPGNTECGRADDNQREQVRKHGLSYRRTARLRAPGNRSRAFPHKEGQAGSHQKYEAG